MYDKFAKSVASNILAWGDLYRQEYPWRYLDDTYLVLISEFMLHRTQVSQVEKIYRRFTTEFPNLKSFALGDHQLAKSILAPLGLNWRIESMIKALLWVWNEYRHVPNDVDELMAIPGVGGYIANATVCFTKNVPLPLVDTNTVRVTGRLFGLDLSGEARRRKEMLSAIESITPDERPRDFYYSIIDLAHIICKPKKPACSDCPLLSISCNYGTNLYQAKGSQ